MCELVVADSTRMLNADARQEDNDAQNTEVTTPNVTYEYIRNALS